ncbi:MAG: NAD(+) diphosphatase, partial [Solirubrobacteraceae bacterium]
MPSIAGMPFTGAELDRVSAERKDPGWVAERLRDPTARAILAGADGVVVDGDGRLRRVGAAGGESGQPVLLGVAAGAPCFALDLDALAPDARAAALAGGRLVSLREAGAMLAHAEAGLSAYAVAILNWHRRHGHCANCGARTEVAEAGASRHCRRCGQSHFPRTDPVVIMTVEHDDRLLLGSRAGWPAGRMSVLAGFVSPGESAEEAVAREVLEESGIRTRDPVYVASQPWPFPASLMLGFHAQSDGGQPRIGDGELAQVGWYDRATVAAAARLAPVDWRAPSAD